MNYSIIRYILCRVLEFAGIFLSLPCLVALIYREKKSGLVFLTVMVLTLAVGFIGKQFKPKSKVFYAKEGFVTVSLSWILLSLVGALPFYFSREIPVFTDALYETISGLTTTGNTILADVEVLSRSVQFWRCFTHWIGGMGVLVLILAVLPLSGSHNMHLMRAESPGPSVGKLVPRVKNTAMVLYGIYIVFTFMEVVFLVCAGLPLYDALLLSFSTAGTGGFGMLNSSVAGYGISVQIIILFFMLLCGINFNVFYLLLIKKPKEALFHEEMRWYLGIVLGAAVLIAINIRGFFGNIGEAFYHGIFQVISVSTTTGFVTVDYNFWPEFSKTILILLTLCGACAGSTGGGFKVSRLIILFRTVQNELAHVVHPRSVKRVQYQGRTLDSEVTKSVQVYLAIYVLIFVISLLLVSVDDFSLGTNFTAVAACLNNVGPGLNEIGPVGNYSFFSPFVKYVLMFDMLIGRLELIPLIILLSPKTWKK